MPHTTSRRALVTGASSGVGAAFAQLLSAQGFDLVLVGRDRARLRSVAASLPRPAQVIVADLARERELAKIEAVLSDRTTPVDLLVNNAASGKYGPIAEHDPDLLRDTIALNVTALVRLCRAALPGMAARRCSGIINVSSVAGSAPSPRMATYSATKAFVDSWTASLAKEVRGSGVTITCVRPGFVRTNFHARSGEVLDHIRGCEWLTPDDVATHALRAHFSGKSSVTILPQLPPLPRLRRWVAGRVVRHVPRIYYVWCALRRQG